MVKSPPEHNKRVRGEVTSSYIALLHYGLIRKARMVPTNLWIHIKAGRIMPPAAFAVFCVLLRPGARAVSSSQAMPLHNEKPFAPNFLYEMMLQIEK